MSGLHCSTDRFHKYPNGRKFDVHMHNNPLMHVLTRAKLHMTGQCWVASLANYDFKLHYKTGKGNVEADALLCIQWECVT